MESEWISTRIGLPTIHDTDCSDEVLVCTKYDTYWLARLKIIDQIDKMVWFDSTNNDVLTDVVAWKTLPDKYIMKDFDYEN